jgi:hypothetical protein
VATTAFDRVGGDKSVVVARVNGELKDLSTIVSETDIVEPVTVDSPEGLAVLRHSTAHVLAQAVQDTFPEAKLGIGPPIKDGFYYDFSVDTPFTPDDLEVLEKRMVAIIKAGQRFSRRVVDETEAAVELAGEPFKLRLIGSEGGADEDRRALLGRSVPRSARARHPIHPAERDQADAHCCRVLARRPEERAAAACLRHRMAVQGRPQGLPDLS